MKTEHHCQHCGANWSADVFSAECEECGGGAMEIACPLCDGKCGERWRRAVMDSHDSSVAHWIGKCAASMHHRDACIMGDLDDAG